MSDPKQGKVTIELQAATTEELRIELQKVLAEVDKLKIDPVKGLTGLTGTIPNPVAWKVSYET